MALSTRLTDTGLGVRADIDALEVTTGTHTTELAQITNNRVHNYELEVSSSSVNQFDKSTIITGYEINVNGFIVAQADSIITDYIKVVGQNNIYVSGLTTYVDGLSSRYGCFYDENFIPIGTAVLIARTLTYKSIAVPSGSIYFALCVDQRSTTTVNMDTIQIQFGTAATTYEPYSPIISTVDVKKSKGKTMLLFGDSVTATATLSDDGATYTEGTRSNWPTFAFAKLQLKTMWNYATSGAAYKDRDGVDPQQKISVQVANAIANNRPGDIIVIFAGTNDTSSSGDYATAMGKALITDLDKTLLYEAIRWAFWTIKTSYPNAICLAVTPLQRASREPVTALSDAIKSMANRYNFIVIDAEYECGIVRDFEVVDEAGRYLSDGLHPSVAGQKLLSNYVCCQLLKSLA